MPVLLLMRRLFRSTASRPGRPLSKRLVIERLEDRFCLSTWSDPVDLGPVINCPGCDNRRPAISADDLSIFFSSNRLGRPPDTGPLWVSHRDSVDDPWGESKQLGPAINDPSATQAGAPNLSPDQHWLFFHSDRTDLGSAGGFDIYASYRPDVQDDFGWQTPINLGPGVNTEYGDYGPTIFEDHATGITTLYFNSDRPGLGDFDIYASTLQGFANFGPAVLVPELSSPYRDTRTAIRSDGLEIFLTSNRPGGLGTGLNIWVSTRDSTLDPWSTPENLGAPINMDGYNDGAPALSADGNTMYFYSNRPGSIGDNDLYMSTRLDCSGSAHHDPASVDPSPAGSFPTDPAGQAALGIIPGQDGLVVNQSNRTIEAVLGVETEGTNATKFVGWDEGNTHWRTAASRLDQTASYALDEVWLDWGCPEAALA